MKIKKLEADLLYNKDMHLTIIASDGDFNAIHRLSQLSEEEIQKYDLRIEKRRKQRSLDANAYLWVLIGKLAEKLHITPEEVYRQHIIDTAAYYIQPVRDDTLIRWIDIWQSKGTGWIVEVIGASKNKGWTNCKNFYGSSVYDSREMSFLIDEVVKECKEQGIETMTPEEIEKLKMAWRSNE